MRKVEHINVCLREDVEFKKSPGFEAIELLHEAFPDLDFEKIDTSVRLFGKELRAPIIISGMTGGAKGLERINKEIAKAAQILGIGMGVGSQRAAIEDEDLEYTYKVRDVAPDILLFANLGMAQFLEGYGAKEAKKAVEMIQADALFIHLNAAQEVAQPEGDWSFSGALEKLRSLIREVDFPILVKETGCGISAKTARKLASVGVAGIDVAGAGGTSWVKVEYFREKNPERRKMLEPFLEWGIPTVRSLIEVKSVFNGIVIGSGGVRNGLDVAKVLALGADAAGVALPVLKWVIEGGHRLIVKNLEMWIEQLKIAMFLTGSSRIGELRGKYYFKFR